LVPASWNNWTNGRPGLLHSSDISSLRTKNTESEMDDGVVNSFEQLGRQRLAIAASTKAIFTTAC
jgi:hypothetical protein